MTVPILDSEALDAACFALARALMWRKGPVPVEPIRELATAFVGRARDHAEYLAGQHYDPNITTRAVGYIEHHHALPAADAYLAEVWFAGCLDLLIELACCNTGPSSASELFYKDIEAGLARARAGY